MDIIKIATADRAHIPEGVLRIDYRSATDRIVDWALVWPGERRDLWIVVIHGHGSSGDQLFTRQDVREAWLGPFRQSGAGLLCVNLRGNAWMCPPAALDLHDLLTHMRLDWGLERTLFCSGSMGATSNLIYAVLHPNDVQGIVARGAATDLASYHRWCLSQDRPILGEIARAIVCSYAGTPDERPAVYQQHSALYHADRLTMPIYFTHGAADATIPVSQAQALAQRLAGSPRFVYREIPNGGHDSPLTETDGFGWVLDQLK